MILPVRPLSLLFIAGIAACGTGGPPQIPDAEGRQVVPVTLLRWPAAGGTPALYRFPTLEPALWEARGTTPALRRLVGVDEDQRQAYALDSKDGVVAIDLESGRNRPFLTAVAAVDEGPDGTIYSVASDRTLTAVSGRLPTPYPGKLPTTPTELIGTGGDQVYALVPGDSGLVVAREGQAPTRAKFPATGAVHTRWGDVLAAPSGDGVLLYEPTASRPTRTLDVGGKPSGLAFSPSGHRLYVTTEGDDQVTGYDRYGWARGDRIDLPGPATALRADPLGRYLLARPAQGDSIWVVDLVKEELVGSWNSHWRADLPAIAGGRWLIVREGQDVVTYDLFATEFTVAGRVKGGAADLWQVLDWSPHAEGAASPALGDSTPAAPTAGRATIYVQLSSSQNPAWADELANKLKGQGLNASVIRPVKQDEFYRVVLGPYASRETADSVGTRLGQPYFLYIPQDH